MRRHDLNNVSYVTLALIGDGGASPQDLVDMNRRGGQIFYAVADSRLYAEPKRLEELGYVQLGEAARARRASAASTRSRRRAARRCGAGSLEPPAMPRIQNEAVVEADVGRHPRRRRAARSRTLLTLRDAARRAGREARRGARAARRPPPPPAPTSCSSTSSAAGWSRRSASGSTTWSASCGRRSESLPPRRAAAAGAGVRARGGRDQDAVDRRG